MQQWWLQQQQQRHLVLLGLGQRDLQQQELLWHPPQVAVHLYIFCWVGLKVHSRLVARRVR
jgi:hypothetical protein